MTPLLLALMGVPALAQDADPAATEEPLPLIKLPELVEFVEAPYPPEAQEQGLEGEVLLLIVIDEEGAVTEASVLAPIGHGFDEAAIEAVRQMRFSPAEDELGPVPVEIEFAYGFSMEGKEVEPEPEEIEAPVNFDGIVQEMGTRRLLPEMAVSVDDGTWGTTTDDEGRFELRGLTPGSHQVRISRPGWIAKEISVVIVEGEVTELSAWIRNESYTPDSAIGVYRREKEEITRRTVTVEEIRRVPGSFGDPVRVVQSLPGAARSPFGTGLLIIRGSNPEDTGVYVEGIRIPFIYHLGGYVSVINPDLIESVDYLPGGYGPQYGRSMGGVIDVSIKEEAPERHRVVWSTDLLDSGGLYEGRLGDEDQHHVGVAARRSYIDLVLRPFSDAFNGYYVAPKWSDYQLRYHYAGWDRTKVTALVFGFADSLLVQTPDDVAQGTDQDFQGDIATDFGTHRALVKIETQLTDTWSLKVIPSMGYDYSFLGFGGDLTVQLDQYLPELRAEAPWQPSEKFELVPGLDFIWGYGKFDVKFPFDPDSFVGDYDPLAEREDWGYTGDAWAWGPDPYIKAKIRPFDDTDRLLLGPGFRASHVTVVDQYSAWGFDPRFNFRLRVLPGGYLKAATGIYTQPPQPQEGYNIEGDVGIGFERAWSSAVGWDQELGQGWGSFDIEGFYKRMYDLLVLNPDLEDFTTDAAWVNEGIGRVYGMEIMARKEHVGNFFGWVSYTLSKSERFDYPEREIDADESPWDAAAGEGWYLFEADQTHILVAVAGYDLPWDVGVSGRFQYTTGNPYTEYAGGVYDIDQDFYTPYQSTEYNAQRLPPYVALDLRVDKRFVFKRGTLLTYVYFLNAYRGDNPEFVLYNYDYTESRYVRSLPFIPSPGFELDWTF